MFEIMTIEHHGLGHEIAHHVVTGASRGIGYRFAHMLPGFLIILVVAGVGIYFLYNWLKNRSNNNN